MGQRRDRLDTRLLRATETRQVNSLKKFKERNRRDTQMVEIIKNKPMPYTSALMNWAGQKLGKKVSRITEADLKSLISNA